MRYIRLPTPHIVRKMPDVVEFNIIIPDKKTLDWLNSIPSGMRNDAIKNIVRGCLCGPVLCEYFNHDNNDNISLYNNSIENTISCIRTKEEIADSKNAELKKIQQILSHDGISPEKILDLLKKEKEKEAEEEIAIASEAEKREETIKARPVEEPMPADKTQEKETEKPDEKPEKETKDKKLVEEPAINKPLSYDTEESDDSFDLFGAVEGLMG